MVPFAPGGGTDILGRLLGQKLTDRFGKPFVVENRPGAGTVTAATRRQGRARWLHHHDGDQRHDVHQPDHLQEAALRSGARTSARALICHVPFVLVVNTTLPVHSVADLLKLAKESAS